MVGMGGFEGGAGSLGEGSGHFDGVGWGSLLYRLDEGDVEGASNSTKAAVSSSVTFSFTPSSSSSSPSSTATLYPSVSVESVVTTRILLSTLSSSPIQTPTTLATSTGITTTKPLPTDDADACSPQ